MRRVLFVDHDPQVLHDLRQTFGFLRNEWEMAFADSAEAALDILAQSQYSAVVADSHLPAMSLTRLLAEMAMRHPEVLRIVLGCVEDREAALPSAGYAQRFLLKSSDPSALRGTIENALNLRYMLQDSSLRRAVSSLRLLPSVPVSYLELMHAIDSPDASAAAIGAIVARDIAMASKVLQLVNSALFGARRTFTDAASAVSYLGFDAIRALALQVAVFSQFKKSSVPEFSIEALQQHSLRVAARAKTIAKNAGLAREAVSDCMAGGLLHDVGKLVLAANVPARYSKVLRMTRNHGLPLELAELQEFGSTHSEVGAYLFQLWGIPDVLTEIVALHHNPPIESGPQLSRVGVVYIANVLDRESVAAEIEPHCLHAAQDAGLSWAELTCEA